MSNKKRQRKRYDIGTVTGPGDPTRIEFSLDINANRVVGLGLTADREDLCYQRGTIKVEINGEEVVREDTHARWLMSGLGVEPDKRLLTCDILRGNGQVVVSFSDKNYPTAPFAPYSPSLYLEIEIDD